MLSTGDDKVGLEPHEDDPDEIALLAGRSTGSMSVMSGADGMGYMEYRYAWCSFLLFCCTCN